MNTYNCNPFNGNYLKCGSFGPACPDSGCGNNCGCGCGCGNSCGCGCGCGCGCEHCCGCGNSCGCSCQCDVFIPTPEVPFPCAARASGCGCGANTGCGCQGSANANTCASCTAVLENPCYGLPAIHCQLDSIQSTVNEIYELMAPVPCPCSCPQNTGCGCYPC